MKDVEGKVAFITGGASGVGFGMAQAFASAGMKVMIADIRQDHIDQAMDHFSNTNLDVRSIKVDITDRKAMAEAADEAEARVRQGPSPVQQRGRQPVQRYRRSHL